MTVLDVLCTLIGWFPSRPNPVGYLTEGRIKCALATLELLNPCGPSGYVFAGGDMGDMLYNGYIRDRSEYCAQHVNMDNPATTICNLPSEELLSMMGALVASLTTVPYPPSLCRTTYGTLVRSGLFLMYKVGTAARLWFLGADTVYFAAMCEHAMAILEISDRPSVEGSPIHLLLTCGPAWWGNCLGEDVALVNIR